MPLTAAHTESIAQRMPFLSRRGDFACSLGAMAKIAISYRRTNSDVTGRIFDRFVQRYGKDSVSGISTIFPSELIFAKS